MKEKNSRISIIFPSYNGERFLRRNLDSILQLPYKENIELIIIDNNSMDNSIKVIESYSKDLQISLYKQATNLGFAKACNFGVQKATGEFIFITNQDVIFTPNFFEKLMDIYVNNKKDEEIVISPALIFEENGIHYYGAKIHFLGFSYTKNLKQKLPNDSQLKETKRFSGGSLFMRKSLFLELGGFFTPFFMYYEDTDLSLRMLRKGFKIYTTNDPYLIHQKHEWNFSDFQYYLLERNRFLVFFRNIDGFKKVIPYFIIIELMLIFQSFIIKKFRFRMRMYYELLINRKHIKMMRINSKKKSKLLSYDRLSRELDSVLIGDNKLAKIFSKFLKFINYTFKLI